MVSYWSNHPFIRITLSFIAGILYGTNNPIAFPTLWLIGTIVVAIYVISTQLPFLPPTTKVARYFQGATAILSFFWAGNITMADYQASPTVPIPQLHPAHKVLAYTAVIVEEPRKRQGKPAQVAARIQYLCLDSVWQPVHATVILHLQDPTNLLAPSYGDVLLVKNNPSNGIKPPKDRRHTLPLSNRQLNYHHAITPMMIKHIAYAPPSYLQAYCLRLQKIAVALLSKHMLSSREKGIIQTLVLGAKDDLEPTIQQSYAATGTLHVLAVSGLHVGILYALLTFLYHRGKARRRSNLLFTLLTIALLWLYAGITGLSPSVCRATLMFSLVSIGQIFKKRSHIYNTVAASALLLLVWNPTWLFSVSFQLSYGAVIGIIYLQPRLYSLLTIHNPLLQRLWLWTTLSLAAQGATTFLQLYYFHQFPVYFIIANWLVVPAAFFIFTGGILVLLASTCCDTLSKILSYALQQLTYYVNTSVEAIAQWPYSFIENIYLTRHDLYGYYICALAVLILLHRRTVLWLLLAIMLAIATILQTIQTQWCRYHTYTISIAPYQNYSAISLSKGLEGFTIIDQQEAVLQTEGFPYNKPDRLSKTQRKLYTQHQATTNPELPVAQSNGIIVGTWGGKKWIIINKPSIQTILPPNQIFIDYVILANNSVAHLQPLLEKIAFERLIVDSSNSHYLIRRLQKEARSLTIPLQTTPWSVAWQEN